MRDLDPEVNNSAPPQTVAQSLAAARQFLPARLALAHLAAPQIIGWHGAALLYLHFAQDGASLYLWRDGQCHCLLDPAALRARCAQAMHLPEEKMQCWLGSSGARVYWQSGGRHGHFDLPEMGMPALPKLEVDAAPLRMAACGQNLLIPDGAQILAPQENCLLRMAGDNLLLQDVVSGSQYLLTCDGEAENAYASPLYFGLQIEPDGSVERPLIASFAPDGRHLLSYKLDYRACTRRHLLRNLEQGDQKEQVLAWPEVMCGQEQAVPHAQLVLFDLQHKRALHLNSQQHGPQFPFFDADYASEFFLRQFQWQEDALYFLCWERGRRAATLWKTDLHSGDSLCLYQENSPTLLDYPFMPDKCLVAGDHVFWISERDGWAHLYLLDAHRAQQHLAENEGKNEGPRQLTRGKWAVRQILGWDQHGGWLYFLAGGREDAAQVRDPYFRQLYRLHLESGDIQRLSQEDADYEVVLAADCSHYCANWSRPDLTVRSMVFASDGQALSMLGQGDFSPCKAWRTPFEVKVKARDGVHDLYGLLLAPPGYDKVQAQESGKTWPLVVSYYPGCHAATVPKRLEAGNHLAFMQSLAALGFFVLRLDSMGGPGRSKAFHDVCYRNLGEAGLPDQIGAIAQLAGQYPLDLSRVAIIGTSAGGHAAARAMLLHPGVFKLGIAAAGCHDYLYEAAEWTEDYGGWPLDKAALHAASNTPYAAQMQGRLLLIHGSLDDNVSPMQSMRLGQKLLAHHKQVEMLMVEGADHAALQRAEVQEYVWRYLLANL